MLAARMIVPASASGTAYAAAGAGMLVCFANGEGDCPLSCRDDLVEAEDEENEPVSLGVVRAAPGAVESHAIDNVMRCQCSKNQR